MKFRAVKINSATKVFDFEASSPAEAMGIAPKVAHFGRRRNCQTTNCNKLYLYTISADGREQFFGTLGEMVPMSGGYVYNDYDNWRDAKGKKIRL